MPNTVHSVVQADIAFNLKLKCGKKFTIGTELTLDMQPNPLTPDVVVMEKRLVNYQDDTPRESQPPIVAIEIISPSQGYSIFKEKIARYFNFGVQSFWLVEPYFKNIRVFSAPGKFKNFEEGEILLDPTIGVEIPLQEIFS